MFRRKQKNEPTPIDEAETALADADPADPQVGPAVTPDAVTDKVPAVVASDDRPEPSSSTEIDRVEEPEPGRAAIAYADAQAPAAENRLPDIAPDSAEAVQRMRRYAPSDAPLTAPHGGEEHLPVKFWVGSVKSVITKSGTSSAEERDRDAAADFQAAIMPGLMGLRDAVPDAASPDDALRVLTEREAEHEYPNDPEAGSLAQRDIFRTDASVYYRIRNRFDKPRRRAGWNNPWRPPPGLARPDPPRRALNRGN